MPESLVDAKKNDTAPKQERVSLDVKSAAKVDLWIEQVNTQIPGIKVGRSELVRWLVASHGDDLHANELQEIRNCYFDEMEFALWAVRRLRESRAMGEKLSLVDLLGNTCPTSVAKKPRKKVSIPIDSNTEEAAIE